MDDREEGPAWAARVAEEKKAEARTAPPLPRQTVSRRKAGEVSAVMVERYGFRAAASA